MSHIGAIATDYYNQFQFRSDIIEFFDPSGYNTAHFSQALPYAAPLGVTILNDYFQYHMPIGGDANQDGSVNVSDLAILAANYRKPTTAGGVPPTSTATAW